MKALYNKIASIESVKELKKYHLTLSDLQAVKMCFNDIVKEGSAKTFIKSVADFFQLSGLSVTIDRDSVNYIIKGVTA